MKATVQKTQYQTRLVCPHCRNTNRFIEVMAEEAHVVNGRGDYIRLLAAVVDHYVCGDCGETIELDAPKQMTPNSRKTTKNTISANTKTRRYSRMYKTLTRS